MSSSPINQGIESKRAFAERAGAPSEIAAALGYVVLGFADLERELTRAIVVELRAGELAGETAAAELPFKQKVHLISSLLRIEPSDRGIAPAPRHSDGKWELVATRCFQAEELRNRLLHSAWEPYGADPQLALRFKRTAKAKHRLKTSSEILDSASILDVADFIDRVGAEVEQVFASPPWSADAV